MNRMLLHCLLDIEFLACCTHAMRYLTAKGNNIWFERKELFSFSIISGRHFFLYYNNVLPVQGITNTRDWGLQTRGTVYVDIWKVTINPTTEQFKIIVIESRFHIDAVRVRLFNCNLYFRNGIRRSWDYFAGMAGFSQIIFHGYGDIIAVVLQRFV